MNQHESEVDDRPGSPSAGLYRITLREVFDAFEAGHDELYDLAGHLGADVGELRAYLDELVGVGWLGCRDCDGVVRYRIGSAAT